jgi:small subunit ribosomal protein S6
MTLPAPTYDLVLLLDTKADDDTRAKIVATARAEIEAQGEFLRHDEWGVRALTYPIDRQGTAEYHLLQFHAPDTELLNNLNRTLRIADEVLRHRIIKLAPGVPDAPDMSAGAAASRRPEDEGDAPLQAQPDAVAEPAPAPPAEAEPAPPAEAQTDPPAEADAELAVGEPS